MKRFILCAAAALAASATAQAATFSEAVAAAKGGSCAAQGANAALTAAAGFACASGSVSAISGGVSGKLVYKVTVPAGYEHGDSNLQFVLMNNNRKSSWALSAKVFGPGNDRTAGTGPIGNQGGNQNFQAFGTGAWTKSDGSETATIGYALTWNTPCAGEYLVSFANSNSFAADFELYYSLSNTKDSWMPKAVASGGKVSIRGQLLLGAKSSISVPISGDWSTQGYIVKEVKMTAQDTAHTVQKGAWGLSVGATMQGSTSPSAADKWGTGLARADTSPYAWDGKFDKPAGGQDVSLSWHAVSPRSICNGNCDTQDTFDKYDKAWVTVTWPSLTDSDAGGYDWSGHKYFVELDVSITVTEYPDITNKMMAGEKILATSTANKNKAIPNDWNIYTYSPPDNLWAQGSISFSAITDNAANADLEPSVKGPVDNSALSVTWGNAYEFLTYQSSPKQTKWKGGMNLYNDDFWSSSGSNNQMGSSRYLAPYTRSYTPKLIVKVTRSNCNGVDLTYSVKGNAFVSAKGECASYQDCFAPVDDHPTDSDRLDQSANSDSSRFVHCIVGTDWSKGAGMGMPKTMCTECMKDCDCNPGQYCSTDAGTCSNSGVGVGSASTWQCDPASGAKWGTCQNKNKDILGSRCRPNNGQNVGSSNVFANPQSDYKTTLSASEWRSSGTSIGSTATSFPLVVGTGDPLSEDFDTSDRGNTGFGFCGEARYYNATNPDAAMMSRVARTVLWQGTCMNFVCKECTNSPCTGWECLNNELVRAVQVDFTARTYTKNAVAGTALGLTFMVILLQLCTAANVMFSKQAAEGIARSGGKGATGGPVSA